MKRFLLVCVVSAAIYACDKETDPVYDSHLFQSLQANNWVLDSARITDSLNKDTAIYAMDTVKQITRFSSQQYTITNIKVADSSVVDTLSYQVIYNSPNRIFFYDVASQQINLNHYIDIDTVNAESLVLTMVDTLQTVSRSYYHAW